MTYSLSIVALMCAWINPITPKSSIESDHSFSLPVSLLRVSNSLCSSLAADTLQTDPRWTCQGDVIFMIMPYWLVTLLEHPTLKNYPENMSILLPDTPHTDIYRYPWSSIKSVWTWRTQPLLTRIQIHWVLHNHKAAQVLWHPVTLNAWTLRHNYYLYRSHIQGHMI